MSQSARRDGQTARRRPEAISVIQPENSASIRVAQRLGARLESRIDVMGQPALLYRITRTQWATV